MSDRRNGSRGPFKAAIVVAALAALPACELILAESPPEAGMACGTWRGGCAANIDFRTDAPTPTLRAETQLPGNVAYANRGSRLDCENAPWICQLEMGADVIGDRYLE